MESQTLATLSELRKSLLRHFCSQGFKANPGLELANAFSVTKAAELTAIPAIDFTSGYVLPALHNLPRPGSQTPWRGQILDQAARRDYSVKVYPNGSHHLMEVPPDNTDEQVRLKRFPPGFFETMVDWTTTQLRRRAPARR